VIAIGVLYLLDTAGTLDAGQAIDDWWPTVIIAIGAFQIAERSHSTAGPLILIGLGTFLLLLTTEAVGEKTWSYVWPALLIAGGLMILARWAGAGTLPRDRRGRDVIVASGIFGGSKAQTESQQFEGASLTAVFGGVTLDLRQARPAAGGASITATAFFGGIDIIVPRGWRVTLRGTPILGGVNNKTELAPAPPDGAPALLVDALAVLGGVEVKHEPSS
jgi:hypothetical protein